jgi:hypothetical protein
LSAKQGFDQLEKRKKSRTGGRWCKKIKKAR